jgi:hypothetical protein
MMTNIVHRLGLRLKVLDPGLGSEFSNLWTTIMMKDPKGWWRDSKNALRTHHYFDGLQEIPK